VKSQLAIPPAAVMICFTQLSASQEAIGQKRVMDSFKFHGKSIRVEWFDPPPAKKPYATALLFPGNGALTEDESDFYRIFGRYLAVNGIKAGIVLYFDFHGLQSGDHNAGTRFNDYVLVIEASLAYASKLTGQRNIAVFGHSLGSQLALRCLDGSTIGCFIDLSGSLMFVMPNSIKSLPPLLILHGDKDTVVTFESTKALLSTWHDRHSSVEMHVFKDQGHILSRTSYTEVMELSRNFIAKVMCP
jgi:carboxymethylenebutenolidase